MTEWNFADVFEMCAAERGDSSTALVNGEHKVPWRRFDERANGVARALLEAGLGQQAKFAQYLYNGNEYLECVFAAFKAGMVPVNTNYRYEDNELVYLWDNADAEAIVFHGVFAERIERLLPRLGKVGLWLHVDDGSGPCPTWATPYENLADRESPADPVRGPWGRSPDDLYILYTGGTTGLPKGVMWRQDDLYAVLNGGSPFRVPDDEGLEGARRMVRALADAPPVLLPACPLMHGTGAFTALSSLMVGGTVVTMPGRGFDAEAVLRTVESERVNLLTIVGDAFAKPLLQVLDAAPGSFDLSSLIGMISSGVMWSEESKRGLLKHAPQMVLHDAFSSSEALGMGSSISSAGAEARTASFKLGDHAKVIDDDGNEIPPGTGRHGRLALSGRLPVGYYKDEEKTVRTFPVIGGVRYSVPGDYAVVEADGSLRLLGRGTVVINTGGEKVFPEEVEEVLKTHPAVADAACVGVPDERFGEAVAALVQLRDGFSVDVDELVRHVKSELASYKAPRRVLIVESIGRSATGKLDYGALRLKAAGALAGEAVAGE